MEEKPNSNTAYEPHDVGLRGPLIVAIGIIGLVLGCLAGLHWIYGGDLYDRHGPDERMFTNAPHYETPVDQDWQQMMDVNAHRLDGSEPNTLSLDEAKQRIVSQGLPRWTSEQDFEIQRQETYYDARP